MAEAQEVYDRIAAHLSTMVEQSRGTRPGSFVGASCMYRSPTGSRCAVGCAIDDDEYDPRMEGRGVVDLANDGDLPWRLRPHLQLLSDLQVLHDSEDMWGSAGLTYHGRVRLGLIAARHSLRPWSAHHVTS